MLLGRARAALVDSVSYKKLPTNACLFSLANVLQFLNREATFVDQGFAIRAWPGLVYVC